MKRIIVILFILAVVIGGSVAGYQYLSPAKPEGNLAEDPNLNIVEIGRETIVDTVEASGRIEPRAEVEMNFEIGGVVFEVLVKEGQYVKAGTVLARLETDDLSTEIRRKQISLAQSEAELEQLFEPTLVEKVAASQANVESARLNLEDLLDGPDPDEVTQAEANLSKAQIELKQAQWEYDQVAYRGDIAAMPQADSLQEATLDYEAAQAEYNLAVKEPSTAEIAEARYSLANAKANLAELLQEPTASEIAIKQAAVDQARLNLEEAERNLEQAVLVAPTSGVVLDIDLEPGERVLSDDKDAAIVVADTSAYLLKTDVDEIDVGRIQVGQPTTVLLDAFRDQEFEGVVTDISPRPTENESNSLVTYEVTVMIEAQEEDPGLLPGMTANASIETQRLDAVVVVPNRAIQVDRNPEQSAVYVEKVAESGELIRAEIQLGLRNGSVTQVLAGLEEGDRVVIPMQPGVGPAPSL